MDIEQYIFLFQQQDKICLVKIITNLKMSHTKQTNFLIKKYL